MPTIEVTSGTFDTEVLHSGIPVLVDFWAPWCGPCKSLGPLLEELADAYEGQVTIAKVNVDNEPHLATEFGVQSIPTLIAFKHGTPVYKTVGLSTRGALTEFVSSLVERSDNPPQTK